MEALSIMQIEANIDDMNPEYYGGLLECLLAAGALDAWLTPIIMKKGRPGIILSAIAPEEKQEAVIEYLFKNTTTLGVRYSKKERKVLEREYLPVVVDGIEVHRKVALRDGIFLHGDWEYEELKLFAKEKAISLFQAEEELLAEFYRKYPSYGKGD